MQCSWDINYEIHNNNLYKVRQYSFFGYFDQIYYHIYDHFLIPPPNLIFLFCIQKKHNYQPDQLKISCINLQPPKIRIKKITYIQQMNNKKVHHKFLDPIQVSITPQKKKRKKSQVIQGKQVLNMRELDVLNFRNQQTLQVHDKRRNVYKQTDAQFIKDVRNIIHVKEQSIMEVITKSKQELTPQQYDQIHYRAKIHGKANTINQNSKYDFKYIPEYDRCNCGCRKGKGKLISLLTDEDQLRVLGPGILLQFLFIRASAAILGIMALVYGLYALLTNIFGSSALIGRTCNQKVYCLFSHYISDQNKVKEAVFFVIQNWLGVAVCFIWIVSVKVIKYFGEQKNKIIDEKLRSSSDYAIKVQNLPRQSYEEKQVIWHIEDLWKQRMAKQRLKKNEERQKKGLQHVQLDAPQQSIEHRYKLGIKSIQIIYNMQFSRKMIQQIFQLAKIVDKFLVDSDGSMTKTQQRHYVIQHTEYMKAKQKLIDTFILQKDLRKRFLNDPQFRRRLSTTCALIEFHSPKNVKYMIKYFGNEKTGLAKQIKMRIVNFFNSDDHSMLFKGRVLKIQRAPEPSDILWENCQKPESLSRRIGILGMEICILLISFGIIFGIEIFKFYVKRNPQKFQVGIVTTVINYTTSFALQILNWAFWKIMSKLLDLQYNHTQTQKIISLMNIVFILSSINVIGLPIITNYTINLLYQNPIVYGDEGLNSLALDYHISLIIGTLLKILNISEIMKFLAINFRWTRYKIIWHYYKTSTTNNEKEEARGDEAVNKFYEGENFDVAENYIFTITNLLHAAFFCKLQPLILFIMTINIVIFYFVNRIRILRFCKIPDMVQYLVFDNAVWMLGFIPLYFGGGSIILSYFQTFQSDAYPFSIATSIPSFICMGLGLLCVTNPGGILNKILRAIFQRISCIDLYEIMGAYEGGDAKSSENYSSSEDDSISEINAQNHDSKAKYERDISGSTRFESYYVGSNTLNLLGFEKVLKGEQIKQSSEQLKVFCESFFPEHQDSEIELKNNSTITNQKHNLTETKQLKQTGGTFLQVPDYKIGEVSSQDDHEKQSQN